MPKVLAIELSDGDAKAVVLSMTKGAARVEFAGQQAFEPAPRDEQGAAVRAEAVRALLKGAGSRFDGCALVVPKQCATVRRVSLPSADLAEISKMAQFEAEKLIPFNVERHIIGFSVLTVDGVEGSEVLIAAVDEPVMDSWSMSLEQAGLEPTLADVSSLALAHGYARNATAEVLAIPTALIHVGLVHTDITFLRDGSVVTTASVGVGVNALRRDLAAALPAGADVPIGRLSELALGTGDPASAFRRHDGPQDMAVVPDEPTDRAAADAAGACDAWLQKLMTNLQRTYEFALREYSLPAVQRLVLSGDGARVGGLREHFQAQLGAEIVVHDPFGGQAPLRGDTSPLNAPLYGPAHGAALRLLMDEEERGVNLLPERLVVQAEGRQRRVHFGVTAMIAVIFLATGFLAWSAGRDHMRAEHDRYEEYNELLEPMVKDLSDKGRRMQIITDHVQPDRAGILSILEAISDYEPIGPVDEGGRITLTDVKYSMGALLEVSGMALEADDVSDFVLYLDSMRFDGAKLFSSVNVRNQSTTSLPRRDQTIYSFQVVASLERPETGRRSR